MTKGTGSKCGGKLKRREGTCTQSAGWGTNHPGSGRCKLHGGCSPSGQAAAATERIMRFLHDTGAPPIADPIEALQRLAGRALTLEEKIGEIVNGLSSIRYETESGGEQLRAEVAVLERAMDRCGRLLVDIAKLNIDDRLARVTEKQVALAEQALVATLAEMGMDHQQQTDACGRLNRHLRAVA